MAKKHPSLKKSIFWQRVKPYIMNVFLFGALLVFVVASNHISQSLNPKSQVNLEKVAASVVPSEYIAVETRYTKEALPDVNAHLIKKYKITVSKEKAYEQLHQALVAKGYTPGREHSSFGPAIVTTNQYPYFEIYIYEEPPQKFVEVRISP